MKENVLDVLMYLFENFMDEETPIQASQETLKTELIAAGFPEVEINKAFAWLEGLSREQEARAQENRVGATGVPSVRIFTSHELDRLDVECRGFLLFLEQVGVLDQATRELVIDRVMALGTEEIDLEQLKWVILMVLFNQPGQEAALAWMEDLVFNEMAGKLH
jgi:Smg protein